MIFHRPMRIALLALVFDVWSASADSFLASGLLRKDQVQNVLEHQPVKAYACDSPPTGPIETTKCDYEMIESVNDQLFKNLGELVLTPFFKFFQVDLYRECPFWQENGLCMNRECAITTIDESEVPEKWRAAVLSKIERSAVEKREELPGCYYRDSDFCYLDDLSEGDYFDLSLVPERFTGYSGVSAHRVWRAIYEENCFGVSDSTLKTETPSTIPDTLVSPGGQDEELSDAQCLEKRVFHKVISGLHASISTHVCHDYLNQTTGEWGPNLQCFITRVASHPERLQYIYFNTVLLLRAVARLGPHLQAYDYCSTGTHEDHAETLERLNKVISIAHDAGKFDEKVLFQGENANSLKEEFKGHFRNVTRIMDCVGCDKCRLWGKVQTTGIATAMKILFEMDETALDPRSNSNLLQRSEVVALINTLHRFSESLEAVGTFRRMWAETTPSESAELLKEAEHAGSWPQPPPFTGDSEDEADSEGRESGLAGWIYSCTDSASACLDAVVDAWDQGKKAIRKAMTPSGKERGPEYAEL